MTFLVLRDVPRPPAACPECGERHNLFWHCALQDGSGVYDWGTLLTCNKCGVPFTLQKQGKADPLQGG